MIQIISFLTTNWTSIHDAITTILAGLFAISEILGQIPSIKANNVFQLVQGWLQKSE